MATQQQTKPADTKSAQANKANAKNKASGKPNHGPTMFSFNKMNYQILAVGSALLIIGFALMSGGKTPDPKVFDYDVIYSARRVDLATIVVLIGFIINIYAVMYKPKEEAASNTEATPSAH